MHGLIFETSIYDWQDQPGIYRSERTMSEGTQYSSHTLKLLRATGLGKDSPTDYVPHPADVTDKDLQRKPLSGPAGELLTD
jgi:hypothetical protein